MSEIPLKYRVRLQGEYNADIERCPKCNWRINNRVNYDDNGNKIEQTFEWIIGLTDDMVICECQKCFTKWHHHHRGYDLYVDLLDMKNGLL